MDENLKIEKKDVVPMLVKVVKEEVKKEEPDIHESYWEIKVDKKDIEEIDVE